MIDEYGNDSSHPNAGEGDNGGPPGGMILFECLNLIFEGGGGPAGPG